MNDTERAALAALVTAERMRQYGTRSAAYRAAGLNATTWQRIEDGLPVRQDRLVAAVRTLWPESGGDWRRVGVSDDRPLADYEDRAILGEIEARLDERKVEGRGHRAAATTHARGSLAPEGVITVVTEALETYFRRADKILDTQHGRGRDALLDELRTELKRHVASRLAEDRPDSAADVG